MHRETPTKQDRAIIGRQIGRRPRGLLYVARRCPYGAPQVIITHPLLGRREAESVFPTVYWLTCPALVKTISLLEASGEIEAIRETIEEDDRRGDRLKAAHRQYACDRLALLTDEERAWISNERPAIWKAMASRGVAGIRPDNCGGIKCLHGHYAHYLAGGDNPVGELVLERIRARGLPELCGQAGAPAASCCLGFHQHRGLPAGNDAPGTTR